MSISSVKVSIPLFSGRNSATYPHLRTTNLRPLAMAADSRDSLDHLQRVSKQHQRHHQPPSLRLWDRFPAARTVQQMMEAMERMPEDPFGYPPSFRDDGYRRGRTPWEIRDSEEEFRMRFDMPGMTKEDVKVWVEEKMLVVKAEKMTTKKKINEQRREEEEGQEAEEEGKWPAKSYGRYSSRIALPDNAQVEKIKADVKDGVLYITIPKTRIASRIFDIKVQ
ncbi:Small heat shock protein [Nymphaea thermarum]|nr:Small heat shock protein [Nymphaea thermarum]